MAIAMATLRTNVYTIFYNHLQTGTYAITSSNIHPSFNESQLIQEGYPQIIINNPIIGQGERLTVGRANNVWEFPITVNIDIYEDSASDAKTVADEVMNKIITGRSVFCDEGFKRLKIESDDTDNEPIRRDKTRHVYTVTVSGVFKVGA